VTLLPADVVAIRSKSDQRLKRCEPSIVDLVVHGGSRLLQQMHDLLEVDIGADWMSKQRL